MTTRAAKLDAISGYFFTAGFFISRARILPFFLLNSVLNIVSLLSYLVGYAVWFCATLFYPHHPRRRDAWYGFAEFKDQFQVASVLGFAASIICLTYPPLLIPALWLFVSSNFIWTVGEFHKKENPPVYDENYSTPRQQTYLKYAYLMTTISVLTASASTIAMFYPPLAPIALLCSAVVGTVLTIIGFNFWRQSAYGKYTPDHLDHSYINMAGKLKFDLNRRPTQDDLQNQEIATYTKLHQPSVSPRRDDSYESVDESTCQFV